MKIRNLCIFLGLCICLPIMMSCGTNYKIQYHLDEGTLKTPIQQYSGKEEVVLQIPVKNGFIFDGWFTNEKFEGEVWTKIEINETGNKDFYAKWTPYWYISYILDGGSLKNPIIEYTGKEEIIFEIPVKKGYEFQGWFNNENFEGEPQLKVEMNETGNKDFYAKWAILKYSLVHNLNGGTMENRTIQFTTLDEIVLGIPVKDGFSFEGWFLSGDFEGTPITKIEKGTSENIILYAKWNVKEYRITYRTDEGILNNPIVFFTKDTDTFLLSYPTKQNYEFQGWYLSSDFSGDPIFEVRKGTKNDLEIYAKWTLKESELESAETILQKLVPDIISQDLELPSLYQNRLLKWNISNENLLTKEGKLVIKNLLHRKQKIQIELTTTSGTAVKEVQIAPINFEQLPESVVAGYVSSSSLSSYTSNSTRYKEEKTIFSKTTIEALDIVYYCFALPKLDGSLSVDSTFLLYLDEMISLREKGVRVVVSINGATKNEVKIFSEVVSKPETMDKFVKNIVLFVEKYHFDGVDVDFEFPGVGTDYPMEVDRANLTTCVKKLREALNNAQDKDATPYLLTAAIPSTSWGSTRFDFAGMNASLDYVNMMSYDLNNGSKTTHVSPLFSSKLDGGYGFSADYGVKRFMELGLSKEKIIIGSAFYGKAYKVTNSTQTGLGIAGTLTQISGVVGSYASGTLYYTGVKQLEKNPNYSKKYDETAKAYYLYSETDKIFVTYDSEESIAEKCKYAQENKIGLMFWSYGEDSTDLLVDTIYGQFKKK